MDLDSYVSHPLPNTNYHLDLSAVDSFFLNGFKKPNSSGSPHMVHYGLNSDGFRSEEFESNTDILFSGCSFTFGAGMYLEHLWTKIVADKFNVKHQNLGLPGSSTMVMVSNLFEYFRQYGNPKTLVCLLPDPYRVLRIRNYKYGFARHDHERDHLLSSNDFYLFNENNYFENIQQFSKEMDGPRILKLPTEVENIIQPDTSYYLSMMSINILEQYCKSNNINFIWSSWEANHLNSLKIINARNPDRFLGLIDVEFDRWDINYKKGIEYYYDVFPKTNRIPISCHQDLFNLKPEIFHLGFDTEYGNENAHWGTHRNMHVADKFISAIYNLSDL
jgi:hypothetical protein